MLFRSRAELERDISDATAALATFSSYIYTSALIKNLSSDDIARVNSDSYSRLTSKSIGSQPQATCAASMSLLVRHAISSKFACAILQVFLQSINLHCGMQQVHDPESVKQDTHA